MTQQILPVAVYEGTTSDVFERYIYPKREPAVLCGVDIGPAVSLWTGEYLAAKCADLPVKVHVSNQVKMDFLTKNFSYKTLRFGELVKRAERELQSEFFESVTEKYYLRSLANDARNGVANMQVEYPQLANDLKIPQVFDKAAFFSSVLRISSANLQLWTHYDVMDNILIQIRGAKRVVLFAPRDVDNLYLEGDKSRVIDIDDQERNAVEFPRFSQATRFECVLQAGEILFIPSLWFHNVRTLDFSVAVNVFWKHLASDLYDSHDVYGNRDPLPAVHAEQSVHRAVQHLSRLPDATMREFYAKLLAAKLTQPFCDRNSPAL